jgi:hypothetical protein
MRYDKMQTQFCNGTIISNKNFYAEKQESYTIFDKRLVLCPFCLVQNEINKFLIMNKKETINKLLGKCPNCKNEMQLRTLDNIVKMTMKELALWVFNYRLTGFWNKVMRGEIRGSELAEKYFKEYCNNLYHMIDDNGDNSQVFWDYYKNLKGESDKEEKEDKENE